MLIISHALRSMCLYADENFKTVLSHILKWFSVEVDPTTTFHSPLCLQIHYSQENSQHHFHLEICHFKSAKMCALFNNMPHYPTFYWIKGVMNQKLVAKPKIMWVNSVWPAAAACSNHFIVSLSLFLLLMVCKTLSITTSVMIKRLRIIKQVKKKHIF